MNFIIYSCAIIKNVINGLTVFFTSNLSETVDVLDILSLRFILSFLVLWLLKVLKIAKIKIGIKDFFIKNERTPYLKDLIFCALFGEILYMFFETLGISMTTGITAGVILSLGPVTGCICESIFLKEKTTLMQKIYLLLGIIGVIYIAVNTNSSDGKDTFVGIMFVLLAVLSGSLTLTFSRKSSKAFSALEITYVSSGVGMIGFNLVNVIRHIINGNLLNYFTPYFNIDNMIGFIFLGILATIIAKGMNHFALSGMQVSTMAAFGGLSTLITIAVGVIFQGENLYPFHIIGLVLILIRMIGVSYIQIKKDKQKNGISHNGMIAEL